MTFNVYIFYTSVRLNSFSISNIENFERFMNLNSIFSHEMISEQFNDVSSIHTTAFNLFIDRIHYLLQIFSGHLNWHNNFFLVKSDAYVHAVPLLVYIVDVYENQCLILIRSSYTSVRFNSVSISHIEDFERFMNHNAFSDTK